MPEQSERHTKKGKRKKKDLNPSRKGTWFADYRRQEKQNTQLGRTKAGVDRWKKRKMGPCRHLHSATTKKLGFTAKLYKQYKANTCVNHHSQHIADIMSQCVTSQEHESLILWSWASLCLRRCVCVRVRQLRVKRCAQFKSRTKIQSDFRFVHFKSNRS